MPRTYVKKIKPNYLNADVDRALCLIKEKKLTVVDAGREYNIPLGTLYSRLSGKRGSGGRGRPPILLNDEEEFLVYVIELFQEWQQPLTRKCVINMARTYMIELGKKISSDVHLIEWFNSFMSRWRDRLKIATSMKLERIRSQSCTKEVITKWFERLHVVLSKLKLLDKPASIWNVDESGFFDDPGRRQVIVKRSTRYAISSQSGSGKSMTTVLLCTSAAGRCLPPYIIYKAAQLYDSWCPKNGYPGARYNVSTNGWADSDTFNDWFLHHFVPNVKHEKRPILLIMDDVVTLSKVKTAWRQLLKTYNQKTNSKPIDKSQFALLIAELFKNSILPSHCVSGFLKSGIYPYDPRVISKEKLLEPPTVITSSSYQPVACSNSIDKSPSNFNDLTLKVCPSTTRPSSCPNILLAEQTLRQNNISLTTSNPTVNCLITTNQVVLDTNHLSNSILLNSTMKDLTISPDIFSNQMESFILDGVTNDISIDANASFNTINTSNVSNIVVNNTPVIYDDNGNKTYTDLVNVSMVANTNNNQALTSPPMYFNRNLYTDNISIFASTSNHCIAPLPVTHLNANASNNSCEISSNDYSTLPSNQNDKLTTQTVLNAITTAIGKHMSPMITSTNKRKRMVERPYGEIIEIKKKTFLTVDNEGSYSATADQDSKPKEVPIATPVSSMQHQYISNTIYQPPFHNTSPLNQPVLQSQLIPYSSYATGPIGQSQSNPYSSYATGPFDQSQRDNAASQSWVYWQYPNTNNYPL
ncbi:unnamed protein product [Rotaria socialis]|uniref:DDE-1 domain-containing protein n=1 Tax=Rotaria socialis TaxID=392032 RepID=A0A821VZF6_9BILA|nr:unnamed protein product [Rotaria socialis]CAF4913955.1 unnamed protein product [Rotaria socialis]